MDPRHVLKAFALVNPRRHANELLRRGTVTRAEARRMSWKAPIAAVVTDAELSEAGLTIEEVAAAVLLVTGSPATFRPVVVHGGAPGYFLRAAGYDATHGG